MTQILIQNGLIITMNETRDVYTKGDILIESNQIKLIGQIDESKLSLNCERYDAKNKIIMPGLINTHVHTSQQLARGLADDVPLLTWLKERIWPYESSFGIN